MLYRSGVRVLPVYSRDAQRRNNLHHANRAPKARGWRDVRLIGKLELLLISIVIFLWLLISECE